MNTLFSLASAIVLPAWLALALAPRHRWTQQTAAILLPALLGLAYAYLLALTLAAPGGSGGGGFGSLDAVAALFSDRRALLAGWLHYLAFDLVAGAWEARDAGREGLRRWILAPCLALTFFVGPVGLLAYLSARSVARRVRAGRALAGAPEGR